MDTQTFLNNLKEYSDSLTEKSKNKYAFYDFFLDNYDAYIFATSGERDKIRELVISPPQEDDKPKSFFEKIFKSKQKTCQIPGLLIGYVIDKALPRLKSSGNDIWLTSGLVAMSMENCYSDWRDTIVFLGDLYQSAETKGLNPKSYFLEIAEISSDKNQKNADTPMKELMAKTEWFKSKEE